MLTLLQAKQSSAIRKVAGFCPDSADFVDLLDEACRMYGRRGDWVNTTRPIYVCARGGCVAFPRYVRTVRKLNICNQIVSTWNNWYSFLGSDHCGWRSWYGASLPMIGPTESPVYSDVLGDGRYIRAYAMANKDKGKKFRIFGEDNNGQRLFTKESDGTWTDGIDLVIDAPFGSTSKMVRRIERLTKEKMTGPSRLYAYKADGDVLEDIGYYEPTETIPSFARYQLNNCCTTPFPILAMVKLRHIKAEADTDLLSIDNEDALKRMIQSIKAGEANDTVTADKMEQAAIREGNLDLNDENDDLQSPVSNDIFRGVPLGHQRCF